MPGPDRDGPGWEAAGDQRLTISRENPETASMSKRDMAAAQPGGVSTVPPAIPVRLWSSIDTKDAPPPILTWAGAPGPESGATEIV